jgi:exosortase/archaeosortase family protein
LEAFLVYIPVVFLANMARIFAAVGMGARNGVAVFRFLNDYVGSALLYNSLLPALPWPRGLSPWWASCLGG